MFCFEELSFLPYKTKTKAWSSVLSWKIQIFKSCLMLRILHKLFYYFTWRCVRILPFHCVRGNLEIPARVCTRQPFLSEPYIERSFQIDFDHIFHKYIITKCHYPCLYVCLSVWWCLILQSIQQGAKISIRAFKFVSVILMVPEILK